jgi:ribosomal protein L37AE/L43A
MKVNWYWVCEKGITSEGDFTEITFGVKHCVKSKTKARILLRKYRIKAFLVKEKAEFFIRESTTHSDRDFKQYLCPQCNNKMSDRELDNTWDWAGPHCSNCGCTGMSMFAEVMKDQPVISCKKES